MGTPFIHTAKSKKHSIIAESLYEILFILQFDLDQLGYFAL